MHKELLEFEDESFQLIAIYSSLEGYRLAYLINKYLRTKLEREATDIDFNFAEYHAFYALYSFKDPKAYYHVELVANKFKGEPKRILSTGSLFGEEEFSTKEINLIPEYSKVDFFLKISEEILPKEFIRILNRINQIPGVQAAYSIEMEKLKNKQNLIFE